MTPLTECNHILTPTVCRITVKMMYGENVPGHAIIRVATVFAFIPRLKFDLLGNLMPIIRIAVYDSSLSTSISP